MGIEPAQLRIFRREAPVSVLGPYQRAVIWVQGCPHGCPGCIVPESWESESGESVPLAELAEWVLKQDEVEGITVTGGEPFARAAALARLIGLVREKRDLGVMCYTGYTLAQLESGGGQGWCELLAATDLLVDGLYDEASHQNLLWRSSPNQQLHLLTGRYRREVENQLADGDYGAGLELGVGPAGLNFTGIPPRPGFRGELAKRLASMGIKLAGGNTDGDK